MNWSNYYFFEFNFVYIFFIFDKRKWLWFSVLLLCCKVWSFFVLWWVIGDWWIGICLFVSWLVLLKSIWILVWLLWIMLIFMVVISVKWCLVRYWNWYFICENGWKLLVNVVLWWLCVKKMLLVIILLIVIILLRVLNSC